VKTDKEYTAEWNDLHIKYVAERNNKMADYCEDLIVEAKEAYYDSDASIMSDKTYDKLERYLGILRPDSEILIKVGS